MTSEVLRDVTNHKIARLSKQQKHFEERKTSILSQASSSPDPLPILIDGLRDLSLDGTASEASLYNIGLFQEQSKHDASIPKALRKQWEKALKRALDAKSRRYQFADLFSKLATEWVDHPNDANILLQSSDVAEGKHHATSQAPDETETFESVGREEMHKQRQEWEAYVFTERKTDGDALQAYLDDLFTNLTDSKRSDRAALDDLREKISKFGLDDGRPRIEPCDETDVRHCINGVLKADLLVGKKRRALQDLVHAKSGTIQEIGDVINMDLEQLDSWQWQPSPVPTHQRRQVHGKYRVFIEPEIHQALLVHWIGVNLAVHLKDSFRSFYRNSRAWAQSRRGSSTAEDMRRREYYLGPTSPDETVKSARLRIFEENFLVTQLPSSIREGYRTYDNDQDKVGNVGTPAGKSPLEVKQTLLHLATTDMLLQKKLKGQFTLVQTDFEWFGPSLPHSTIFAVLRFFHLPEHWLQYIQKFLAVPMVFADEGADPTVRTRKCGVPICHVLSDALAEAVLFCLDLAVVKATGGDVRLYRFHDDVWFWGQEEDCIDGWKALERFTSLTGLQLNKKKTGSFSVSDAPGKQVQPSSSLPKGNVSWGFLVFDASQCRWVINMQNIDEHVVELQRQLKACRSILAWIQAWNVYVSRFFSNNFGQAAHCLGREHLDMVFSAFQHIQKQVFTALSNDSKLESQDVNSYLKQVISDRFGVQDIPDPFLAFPVEYGGLEVRNPFIPLMATYRGTTSNPSKHLETAFEEEELLFEKAKHEFEKRVEEKSRSHWQLVPPEGCSPTTFLSLDEYVRYREQTSRPLVRAYKRLLDTPSTCGVEASHTVLEALAALPDGLRDAPNKFADDWDDMDTYWQWIVQLYAGEAMDKFGGLVVGERNMLPVELVYLLRSEKVRWQG